MRRSTKKFLSFCNGRLNFEFVSPFSLSIIYLKPVPDIFIRDIIHSPSTSLLTAGTLKVSLLPIWRENSSENEVNDRKFWNLSHSPSCTFKWTFMWIIGFFVEKNNHTCSDKRYTKAKKKFPWLSPARWCQDKRINDNLDRRKSLTFSRYTGSRVLKLLRWCYRSFIKNFELNFSSKIWNFSFKNK